MLVDYLALVCHKILTSRSNSTQKMTLSEETMLVLIVMNIATAWMDTADDVIDNDSDDIEDINANKFNVVSTNRIISFICINLHVLPSIGFTLVFL